MKLHVSARNGHHQVYTPIKRILYICVGGFDIEISTLSGRTILMSYVSLNCISFGTQEMYRSG